MSKTMKLIFLGIAMLMFSVPMFAQGTGSAAAGTGHADWVAITAGFSMAIASGLCALGQGKAVAGACGGRHGEESRRRGRDSDCADLRSGADRIARTVRDRYYFRQSRSSRRRPKLYTFESTDE